MFKRDIDNHGSTLFYDIQSQIVNSSLDFEYMRDVLTSRDSSLKLRQQSEAKIDDQMFLNKQFVEKNPNNDQLAMIIETGFQKLSQTIDTLLSRQNALADALRI